MNRVFCNSITLLFATAISVIFFACSSPADDSNNAGKQEGISDSTETEADSSEFVDEVLYIDGEALFTDLYEFYQPLEPFFGPVSDLILQENYLRLKASVNEKRTSLYGKYLQADSLEKKAVVEEARAYLLKKISGDFFAYWTKTAWDFNGITTTPRKGTIACGYFVTTILKDAGFNIPRYKWAQLDAESMILKIAPDAQRFHNTEISEVTDYIKSKGDALWVVGLDCHVGFIICLHDSVRFVHSSYYHPQIGVMSEDPDGQNPLNHSAYRITGQVLTDSFVLGWMQGKVWE